MSYAFLWLAWHFYTRWLSIQVQNYKVYTNVSQMFIKSPQSNFADSHIKFCSKSPTYEYVIGHILWIPYNSRKLKIKTVTVINVFINLWKRFKMTITHRQFQNAPVTLGNGPSLLTACSDSPSHNLYCNSLSSFFFSFEANFSWDDGLFKISRSWTWIREANDNNVHMYSRSNRSQKIQTIFSRKK